jgi:F-type H+-transporting ATPase subunit b
MESLFAAFGIEWKLLLAQGVNFLILIAGLTYFLYKPVMKMLAERAEKIARGVADAEDAAKTKAAIESERADIVAAANHDATLIVSRAEDEGKRERGDIVKAAQERSDSMLRDARAQAAELERQALLKSEKEIARAAVLAAEKILREQA